MLNKERLPRKALVNMRNMNRYSKDSKKYPIGSNKTKKQEGISYI